MNGKINEDIYNSKWQDLNDLLIKKDYHDRLNTQEICKYIKKLSNKNEIISSENKIKFNYKYNSDDTGLIKVKFIFKNLLTTTAYIFLGCSSLKSIDFSSFDSSIVQDMNHIFNV